MRRINSQVRKEREKLVIKYKNQGLTYDQIRELTGFGLSTIQNILERYRKESEARD